MTTWALAEAKARLSEVVHQAGTDGPQKITKNGKDVAVIVSQEEWERRTKPRGSAADFFMNSPLRGSGMKVERVNLRARKISL